MSLKCVVVDDEPLARDGLLQYIEVLDFLQLQGICENALELNKFLETEPVDLIFLDIQMPFMSGLDFLKIRSDLPMVIITTAFPNYALEGFLFDVLDYLVKPITFNRFFKAVNKAKKQHSLQQAKPESNSLPEESPPYFFIRCENKYEKIYLHELLYVQAMQNYVSLFTEKGRYLTLMPLKTVEENLDAGQFIRVHKSYIVSSTKIDSIENHELFIAGTSIPISRNLREEVLEKVVKARLLKKT